MVPLKKLEGLSGSGIKLSVAHSDLHQFPMHGHDDCELIIILEGEGTHLINDQEYRIAFGDVYVIKGEQSHGFQELSGIELANLRYSHEILQRYEPELLKIPGYNALFQLEPVFRQKHDFKSHMRLTQDQLLAVRKMLELIQMEQKNHFEAGELFIELKFFELVIFLSRAYSKRDNDTYQDRLMNLGSTLSYMKTHLSEPVKLSQLARKAGMSVNNFLRLFHQLTGQSPMEYLIMERIKQAGRLLTESDLPVNEIAGMVGFSDSNYFSRQFRKKVECSPREFRRKFSYKPPL
jgi:AraC family L-rhamnose operon transcriptional activator RhaR/AraC family L-rhamnose operon regulatory protein RhaS